VHHQVGAVVPPFDQAVDVEAVVLTDGDEGLGVMKAASSLLTSSAVASSSRTA
jgi:hypothetical protein